MTKKLFYIAIAGSVLCFCGDIVLGCIGIGGISNE